MCSWGLDRGLSILESGQRPEDIWRWHSLLSEAPTTRLTVPALLFHFLFLALSLWITMQLSAGS